VANELVIRYTSGLTAYAVILNNTQQAWNGSAFETINETNWATYAIEMLETGDSGVYIGTMPVVPAGKYTVLFFQKSGASPASSDFDIAAGGTDWTGTAEAAYPTKDEMNARTLASASYSTLTAQQVWEYTTRSLTTFSTLVADTAAAVWASLTSALTGAGTIGKLIVDNLNATVSSRATQTSVDTANAAIATRASQTSVDAIQTDVDTLQSTVDGVKAKTDNLPTDPADQSAIEAAITAAVTAVQGASGDTLESVSNQIDTRFVRIEGATFDPDTETLHDIYASITASSLGQGARTVIVTVNDGTTVLENVRVRLTNGALTYVGSTNVSGQITFNVDDGTWTVTITKVGYTFSSTTLVVDGDESPTYSMTQIIIEVSAPGFITGYLYCYDEEGHLEEGVSVELALCVHNDSGVAINSATRTETSSSGGLVQFVNLQANATYMIRRGVQKVWNPMTNDYYRLAGNAATPWKRVVIPAAAASPYPLPAIFGETLV